MKRHIEPKRLLKYTLDKVPGISKVNMPINSQILHIDEQRGKICLWVEVFDDRKDTETRIFSSLNTGDYLPDWTEIEHMGTVKLHGGDTIIHVYELAEVGG